MEHVDVASWNHALKIHRKFVGLPEQSTGSFRPEADRDAIKVPHPHRHVMNDKRPLYQRHSDDVREVTMWIAADENYCHIFF